MAFYQITMNYYEKVYEVVKKIPKGKVVRYGDIANILGHGNARVVGTALHKNPYAPIVPCHRVVNREGKLAKTFGAGGIEIHAERLRAEGLEVNDNMVDLNKYLFDVSGLKI